MVLESLTRQNADIKRLVIDKSKMPEMVGKFNPDLHLSATDWRHMFSVLNVTAPEDRVDDGVFYFTFKIHAASKLKTMSPEKASPILTQHEYLWERGKAELDVHRTNGNTPDYLSLAEHLILLYPERKAQLDLDDEWKKYLIDDQQYLGETRNKYEMQWRDYATNAVALKMLFPEILSDQVFDEKNWHDILRFLSEVQKDSYPGRYFREFLITGSQTALFFPERRNELGLDEEFWEKAHALVNRYKKASDWDRWTDLIGICNALSIFGADRIDFHEDGLILSHISPEKPEEHIPLPVERNF